MIVFDLHCEAGHVFEAWFGSSQDYEDQRARQLVHCPICDSPAVSKAPMAPAISAKSNQRSDAPTTTAVATGPQASATGDPATMKALMEAMADYQRKVEENCDWVGDRFAEEARALHFGESERDRGIYGEASLEDARALAEEGIAIAPLPFRGKKASDA